MSADLALRWARRLVSAFADAGVRDAVVSPGARSTPLVLAIAAEERLRTHVVVDERAAAFFALGIARASGAPPLLVCTSGTAGAHYLPAIVEAAHGRHPLVVVTADRPVELRDVAAPQTVDQLRLFGVHARHFVELGAPDPAPEALAALPRIAAQCVLAARWPRPGAVHVNASFRKPLEPAGDGWRDEPLATHAPPFLPPRAAPSLEAVELVTRALSTSERGVLAVGALPGDGVAAHVADFAARTGLPLLAETTSQLRRAGAPPPAAPGFDTFLRAPRFARDCAPDLVLELGMPLLSPAYGAWLAAHPRCRRVVVSAHGWSDPLGGASAMVIADPAELVREVGARLDRAPRVAASWPQAFAAADRVVWEETARERARHEGLLEGDVAAAVLEQLDDGAILQLGASTPLRDVDRVSRGPRGAVTVLAPRGANGIDGGVAAAAGAHAATGRPTTLLCGDVALLHDLGSLVLAGHAAGPLTIVVVHNDGGHIFDELPLAATPAVSAEARARYFTTPHGLAFGPAAAFAGVAHARVTTPAALAEALRAAASRAGATLVEAVVPAAGSAAARRRVREAVARRLEELP